MGHQTTNHQQTDDGKLLPMFYPMSLFYGKIYHQYDRDMGEIEGSEAEREREREVGSYRKIKISVAGETKS